LKKVAPLNDAKLHQWYSANYSLGPKRAGASSGIGKAIALSLAGQGAEVCLVRGAGNSWMMLQSKCTRSGRAATLVRRTSPTMTTSAA